MPLLSSFFGIKIRMFWEDGGKHKSPHFHAHYGEYEAVFALDGKALEGKFPRKQRAYVKAWALLHKDELAANWSLAVSHKETVKIEPLR